jgi:hypothetical protein
VQKKKRNKSPKNSRGKFSLHLTQWLEAEHPRGVGGRFTTKANRKKRSRSRLRNAQASTVESEVAGPVSKLSQSGQKRLQKAIDYAKSKGVSVVGTAADDIQAAKGDVYWKIPGMYHAGTRTIYLNERSPYWNNPDSIMRESNRIGWLSTDRPSHVVIHEVAHAEHHSSVGTAKYQMTRSAKYSESEKAIASRVGRYAATQPIELIPEVRAGLVAGKSYDSEVMSLYRKYGGS